jgi:hypothetical protein
MVGVDQARGHDVAVDPKHVVAGLRLDVADRRDPAVLDRHVAGPSRSAYDQPPRHGRQTLPRAAPDQGPRTGSRVRLDG